MSQCSLPTEFGDLILESLQDHQSVSHCILRHQNPEKIPLVRIHSSCLTGEVFHSKRCDCKDQLHKAMRRIVNEKGIIFYLSQEGRGIGLHNKIAAYNLQQTEGLDTQEANLKLGLLDDHRDYELVGRWLLEKDYTSIKLMTNNPLKIKALEKMGINVERVAHHVEVHDMAKSYMWTKRNKQSHLWDQTEE